jgi:hypothetical protein
MGIETRYGAEVLCVAEILRVCERTLAKSHANISSLLAYVADDLEREMREFPANKTNTAKSHFPNASRSKISRLGAPSDSN